MRILMLGCGAVGRGVLPLLFRTFRLTPAQLTIISADDRGASVAARFGVPYLIDPITPENYRPLLANHLGPGDLLLNLSVEVSSLALIAWCKAQGVLYLDTCVEPWHGGYAGNSIETSNAWLRQQALALHEAGAPTAVIAHGMNPGVISHFLKEALLILARRRGIAQAATRPLPVLAEALGVRVVHLSECDTQDDGLPLADGTFANTWSARGFHSEAYLQQAEIGWGAHEPGLPQGAGLIVGGNVPIAALGGNGAAVMLETWTPALGVQQGQLVTHHEVMSIADLLGSASHRPTVCYVYNACPKARLSLERARGGGRIRDYRVLAGETLDGLDEIGVLLFHDAGALWHGATLTAGEARRLAPHNSATTLQVAAGVVGALAWMLEHPCAGVVEAESMDGAQVLAVARPYLGTVATFETVWRPGANLEFGEFLVRAGKTGYRAARNSREPDSTEETVA